MREATDEFPDDARIRPGGESRHRRDRAHGDRAAVGWGLFLAVMALQMVEATAGDDTNRLARLIAWQHREFDRGALHAQALREACVPLRPGEPGKSPFWNVYAEYFIHAPAFDFPAWPRAAQYRLTVAAGKTNYALPGHEPMGAALADLDQSAGDPDHG